jgi:hypothetical protein
MTGMFSGISRLDTPERRINRRLVNDENKREKISHKPFNDLCRHSKYCFEITLKSLRDLIKTSKGRQQQELQNTTEDSALHITKNFFKAFSLH